MPFPSLPKAPVVGFWCYSSRFPFCCFLGGGGGGGGRWRWPARFSGFVFFPVSALLESGFCFVLVVNVGVDIFLASAGLHSWVQGRLWLFAFVVNAAMDSGFVRFVLLSVKLKI